MYGAADQGAAPAFFTVYSRSMRYWPRRKMKVLVTVTPLAASVQVSGTRSSSLPLARS